MYETIPDEHVNSVIKPVSNPNYNKPPVKLKPKDDDMRKSTKPENLRISVKSDDLRKSTKSMTSNHEIEIEMEDLDTDVETITTATEGNYGYYNVAGIRKGIPIVKLADYVANREKEDFEQEFKVSNPDYIFYVNDKFYLLSMLTMLIGK